MTWTQTLAPYLFAALAIYYVIQQARQLHGSGTPTSSPVSTAIFLAGLSFALGSSVFYVGARFFLDDAIARAKFFMLLEAQKVSLLRFLAVWTALASLTAAVGLAYSIRRSFFAKELISFRRLNSLQLCALVSLPTSAFAGLFVTLRDIKYSLVTVETSLASLEIHFLVCVAMVIVFSFGPLLSLIFGVVGAIPLLRILGDEAESAITQMVQRIDAMLPGAFPVAGDAPVRLLVICALVNAAYKFLFERRAHESDSGAGQISQ